MKEKIKDWLRANKRDIKIMVIGGVILSLYILFFKAIGEETDFGVIGAFLTGVFLTAIFINAYRLWRKQTNNLLEKKEGEGDYGLTKEEIDKYNEKYKNERKN